MPGTEVARIPPMPGALESIKRAVEALELTVERTQDQDLIPEQADDLTGALETLTEIRDEWQEEQERWST